MCAPMCVAITGPPLRAMPTWSLQKLSEFPPQGTHSRASSGWTTQTFFGRNGGVPLTGFLGFLGRATKSQLGHLKTPKQWKSRRRTCGALTTKDCVMTKAQPKKGVFPSIWSSGTSNWHSPSGQMVSKQGSDWAPALRGESLELRAGASGST